MKDFILVKNFIKDDVVEYYLNASSKYNEVYSKVGNRVGKEKKIRKDIFFNPNDSSVLDNIIFNDNHKLIKDNFNVNLKYRETYKLGTYYGEEKGFYIPHTDTQGLSGYRKISIVVCLSNQEDYKGGFLNIIDLDEKFKFDKGDAIFFKSDLLHGVEPVTSGKRQVMITFMWDEEGEKLRKKISNKNTNKYLPNLINKKYTSDTNLGKMKKPCQVLKYPPKIGDIDYSDAFVHKWTDKDDYLFENNNSDVLFITFAGLGCKGTLPTFIFHNYLKQYTTIDKLFLRDIKCKYYLTGLKNSTKDIDETVKFIKKLISVKKYKKIIGLGCSAGGFAAILFGNILNFTKVIAFSPQVVINNDKIEIVKDNVNAPNTCKYLSKYSTNNFYTKCLNLKSFMPFTTSVDIHYSKSSLKGVDKRHAEYIKHEKCDLIEYESNNHLLALELRNSGKLKEIIEKEIF